MRKRVFTQQLGVPVSEEIYQKIIFLCDEQEITISQWVRGAIELKMAHDDNTITTKED